MKMSIYPDKEKCLEMLKEYGTPPHVIRHCTAVAGVAVKTAKELNKHGFDLDTDLVMCAGMLHDIARKENDHPAVGAAYLREKGLDRAADIVKVHMRYPITKNVYESTETDMVCLGDRTVCEDEYVGVDKRMEYIINKAKRNAGDEVDKVVAIILEKKEELKQYISDIEKIIGMSFDELIRGK